jgi:hypothetical protein
VSDLQSALVVAGGIGAVVFLIMLLVGPPPGWRCTGGKPHDFGPWECGGRRQSRKCKACGWTETAEG